MEFLTVQEIAEILKVNAKTVRNWIDNGDLKAAKFGRQYRIDKEDFDKFVKNKKQQD